AADHPGRASVLPRSAAQGTGLGLRLSDANPAHAGHRRGLRSADSADLRAVLPHRAPVAHALRRRAEVFCPGRGPLLALALSALGARRRLGGAAGRADTAGAYIDLPDVQLPDPARSALFRAMRPR